MYEITEISMLFLLFLQNVARLRNKIVPLHAIIIGGDFMIWNRWKKEIGERKASLELLSKKREEMLQEEAELEKNLKDIRHNLKIESDLLKEKTDSVQSLMQQKNNLEENIANLQSNLISLKEEETDIQKTNASLLEKQKTTDETINQLENKIPQLQTEIGELNKTLFVKKDDLKSAINQLDSLVKRIRNEIYVETIENARQFALLADKRIYMHGREWRKYMLQSIDYNRYLSIDGNEHATELDYLEKKFNCGRDVLERLDKSWNTSHVPDAVWSLCNDYLKLNVALTLKKMKDYTLDEIYHELTLEINYVQKCLNIYHYKIDQKYIETLFAYVKIKVEQYQEAKEERERLAEEKKAQQEYARAIKQAQKEEERAQFEIEKRQAKLQEAKTQEQLQKLNDEISKLQEALKDAIERRERALSMAQQTKSGYVYVISNIGSFGEGVYKIGMTRRLDPMERIFELGNASVPFPFDVHTFIYSEDAPALEAYLHKVFDNKKINTVNYRKEYFRVSLDEIKQALSNKGVEADFIEEPAAYQYRESTNLYTV